VKALVLVDLQNDFMPGGALAVSDGNLVVPVANAVQPFFDFVVATEDWHPADHSSFAANHPGREVGEVIEIDRISQILWPVHCVRNSMGAGLVSTLVKDRIRKTFYKGTDRSIDSYSTFYDNGHRQATGLGDYLRDGGVDHVYLLGLATDYCVKFSALDARSLGFRTTLIRDGCRGVELNTGDVDRAIAEMSEKGVELVSSDALMADGSVAE
jgi:nicotinamidase/pyrazinamidase